MSFTGILQFLIATASWTGAGSALRHVRQRAGGGLHVAIKIFMFVILPSWGLSNSAATLVGQNLGAKKPERARRPCIRRPVHHVLTWESIAVVFLLFARQLAAFFTSDPAVQSGGGGLPALHQRGQHLLRVGHGAGAGVQRRGRHADAVDDQLLLLLVLPDSAGVDAGGDAALGTAWSVRRDSVGRNGDDDIVADAVPPRRVEEETDLTNLRQMASIGSSNRSALLHPAPHRKHTAGD